MTDGFRGIRPTHFAVPLVGEVTLHGPNQIVISNLSDYSCLEIPMYFTGTPVVGTPPEVLKVRLVWTAGNSTRPTWVTSLELPNGYCAGFGGRWSFLLTPVLGDTLTISWGNSSAGYSPYMNLTVWGSSRVMQRVVVWQDMTDSQNQLLGTDLMLCNEAGVNIPHGGSVTVLCGLGSGPFTLSSNIAFGTGKTTVGSARISFLWGVDGLGPADLIVTQSATGNSGNFPANLTGFYLPRRPLNIKISDNGAGAAGTHNEIAWWGVSVVRDEP